MPEAAVNASVEEAYDARGTLKILSARFGGSSAHEDSIDVMADIQKKISKNRIDMKVGRFGQAAATGPRRLYIEYGVEGVTGLAYASVREGKRLILP